MWSDGLKDLATPLIDQSDNAWGSRELCKYYDFLKKEINTKKQALKQ